MRVYISFALILFLARGCELEMVSEGMKQLTSGFVKVLETCKAELGLSDAILSDLYHLWKEEYDLVALDTGCMFSCMAKKLDLLDDDGRIHHGNTKDYVVKNGGGEDIAGQLLSLAQDCEKQFESVAEECKRMLEMAKCIRRDISQVQWSPKMEVVITEIIADV